MGHKTNALLVFGFFFLLAGFVGGQDAKKDLDLIQGVWTMDTIGWGDKKLPKDLMNGYKFVFNGEKMTWDGAIGMNSRMGKITAMEGAYPGDFKLDQTKTPKEIDITLHLKKGPVQMLGIYEIKDDQLKLSYFSSKSGRRPVDFSQAGKDNVGFVVLKRAKK